MDPKRAWKGNIEDRRRPAIDGDLRRRGLGRSTKFAESSRAQADLFKEVNQQKAWEGKTPSERLVQFFAPGGVKRPRKRPGKRPGPPSRGR